MQQRIETGKQEKKKQLCLVCMSIERKKNNQAVFYLCDNLNTIYVLSMGTSMVFFVYRESDRVHYVIGDVHGCFDDMMKLLTKIESKDKEAEFIFVGDFIDRGPKVWEVLQWIRENITKDGKYQSVLGNHEYMVIQWYQKFLDWWEKNSQGEETGPVPETRYGFAKWLDGMNMLNPEKIKPVIDFFSGLPYSKILEIETVYGERIVYRIVHADYNYYAETEEEQRHSNLWVRNYWGYAKNNYNNEIVVHGHTPTMDDGYLMRGYKEDSPGMIGYRSNDINVDGGVAYFNKWSSEPCMLCAICLENLEEIYPYSVEERLMQQWEQIKSEECKEEQESEKEEENYYKNKAAEYCKKYRTKESESRKQMLIKIGEKGLEGN